MHLTLNLLKPIQIFTVIFLLFSIFINLHCIDHCFFKSSIIISNKRFQYDVLSSNDYILDIILRSRLFLFDFFFCSKTLVNRRLQLRIFHNSLRIIFDIIFDNFPYFFNSQFLLFCFCNLLIL